MYGHHECEEYCINIDHIIKLLSISPNLLEINNCKEKAYKYCDSYSINREMVDTIENNTFDKEKYSSKEYYHNIDWIVEIIKEMLKPYDKFCVRIDDQNNLTIFMTNKEPKERLDKFGAGICDICLVSVDSKWIMESFDLYLQEKQIDHQKKELIKNKPVVKTDCDLFNELHEQACALFKENNFINALGLFYKCAELYPKNKSYKRVLYNLACCYSKLEQFDELIDKLNKAFLAGYTDWNNIINDSDFEKYLNEKQFVDLIRTIKNKTDNDDDDNDYYNYPNQKTQNYIKLHKID